MKLSDINPHIRHASTQYHHIVNPFDSVCYDCRLFYIKEGFGRVTANDSEFQFSKNTVLFFPAGTKYHFYPDKNSSRFIFIVLNFDLVNSFSHLSKSLGTSREHQFDPARVISYPMPEEFSSPFSRTVPSAENLLDRCCEEFLIQNTLYRETASTLLKLCLLELVKNSGQNKSSAKILPVLDYLHANYADSTLTNQSIAQLFNYHPYYLSQMFKEHTGQSLHQYLISYRVKMAKKLLTTTDNPISTVAWKTGFQSPAYFTKQFKTQTGVSPNTYRKEREHFYF